MAEERQKTPEQEVEELKVALIEGFKDFSSNTTVGLLKRFILMAEIEANEEVSRDEQTKIFTPPLKKGQVVQVKFTGQGTSINGKHFALVWSANPIEGQVVVLPMSSKIRKNQAIFNLGPIDGLRSPINLVKYQQSHTAARQSVHIWTKRIKNAESGNFEDIPVELNDFQQKHMESMFRYTHLREKDLFYKICFETGNRIPEFIPNELLMHINKHLKVKVEKEKFIYKLPHETQFKEFPLIQLSIDTKKRFQLLANLLSSDQATRTSAQQEIHNLLTKENQKE